MAEPACAGGCALGRIHDERALVWRIADKELIGRSVFWACSRRRSTIRRAGNGVELSAGDGGWAAVVPAGFLLVHGADEDGAIRLQQLDIAYGRDDSLCYVVGR